MCGIVGVFSFGATAEHYLPSLHKAVQCLSRRGPDAEGFFSNSHVALGHRRLSVIDVSQAANQPMTDASGRYTIIYNGEIYNFRELRHELQQVGLRFNTQSDTEVLLQLYIHLKQEMLHRLNGFFAFAIYDNQEQTLFLARDRMGIKPLLYYLDKQYFIFASELKALLAFPLPRQIDNVSLFQYLQLTYIPAPYTILKHVRKLEPGHCLWINKQGEIQKRQWYKIPYPEVIHNPSESYAAQQKKLLALLDEAVRLRLVADVPLGAFLSGGIDSSVVVALATRHTQHLNTFSIGYKHEPYFDETYYANLVAKKFKTEHTVFSITTDDMYFHLSEVLDYMDEPFADSSALPVYILSQLTRRHVTVALSGDGGDELFAGYNKHRAEYLIYSNDWRGQLVKLMEWLWKMFPASRNNPFADKFRQLQRFAQAARLTPRERYWFLCSFAPEKRAIQLMKHPFDETEYQTRKQEILRYISSRGGLNEVLYTDMHLVLPNDMLHKVDAMSMANGLEVRVPLLDYRVVEYAFHLPIDSKINGRMQKRILRDAFKNILPQELYRRPKHGFEVPLLRWFRTSLQEKIQKDWLQEDMLYEQGIFNPTVVAQIQAQLFSAHSADAPIDIWKLIVFQNWYKKYFTS